MSRLDGPAALRLLLAALRASAVAPWSACWRSRADRSAWLLIVEIRLPRTLLALGYGRSLGMTGAALQATVRQSARLARHHRSSSGAALGAVLGGLLARHYQTRLCLPRAGAVGALAALALLVVLAGRRAETATLLLAGLAIALAAGAATSLVACARPLPVRFLRQLRMADGQLRRPQLAPGGSGADPGGDRLRPPRDAARPLDLMALGEDVAASLGYAPRSVALEVIVLSSIAVGACVSVCGAIGFVGLIAPYAARRLSGGHPGRALIPAARDWRASCCWWPISRCGSAPPGERFPSAC